MKNMDKINTNITKIGVLVLLVVIYACVSVNGARSNCKFGTDCEKCSKGHFKMVRLGERDVKVCCSGCSKYCKAGNRRSDGRPYCTCYYPKDIKGDCWKGEQCETCLKGPNNGYVGYINIIPVCCAKCERSGLMLGRKLCNCRHNGP
ncbi:uncharacterized protein LOC123548352 [Mercenaria mercenaria]|uniref:uncharacterized protein LOC123548352 n=1 Tax=Mercenaria mercenaria TaxID=6596 RepID=UPI00234F2CB8|nr:uncharacterized protein LOC123548352 [Mercenaria mercenaria]